PGRRWSCRTRCSRHTTSYSRSFLWAHSPKHGTGCAVTPRGKQERTSCCGRPSFTRNGPTRRQFLCDDTSLTVLEAVRVTQSRKTKKCRSAIAAKRLS